MIPEKLAGKRILVTGVTGFLGQALLERLLFDCPESRPLVLIRPQFGSAGRDRLADMLKRPCFERLRDREGEEGLARILNDIEVLEGDLTGELPEFPGDIGIVVHCGATVSFDPPIDEGFRTNLLGSLNLYEAIYAGGSRPHIIHTSTAYVAGMTKGIIPEGPLQHRIDWRAELEYALAARGEAEDSSRRPEMLDSFMAAAKKEHQRAGPMAVSADAEERRNAWVKKRLVQYGRARAQSMGWPDNYTFTKALGERCVEEFAAEHALRLSIVRPSIVESAYVQPFPGWIEGFKMADPIILAFGRGGLPEFPGIAEGVLDMIPVDLVVNAMLAVAAMPAAEGADYYHVSSGARNPLTFARMYREVKAYFEEHPLPGEGGRGEFKTPDWKFPGVLKVERMLRNGERLVDLADTVVQHLPRSKKIREFAARVDRDRAKVEFMRRYADLYAAYTEAEVIYTDDRTVALTGSLAPEDQGRFGFDSAIVDWTYYLVDVHCPTITRSLREQKKKHSSPSVKIAEATEDGPTIAAVFDMEGTILASNVVETYSWIRLHDMPIEDWPSQVASLASNAPKYLQQDQRDRGEFLRTFYRRYEGADVERVRELVRDYASDIMLERCSAKAIRRIREHRHAGHRTILVTASLGVFAEPLAPLFDLIVAAELEEIDGTYSGFMAAPPLVGEARAAWLRRYAETEGIDLKRSFAYADSHSDLPLLRAVGNPVAVDPDVALYRLAKRRRWPVEEWEIGTASDRMLVPEPAGWRGVRR